MDTFFLEDSAGYHHSVTEWNPNYHEDGLDERATALLRSPVGRAFIAISAATGFTPDQLTEPATALYIAAQAADDIELYHTKIDRQKEMRFLREEAPRHFRLARQILTHPDAAWWFAPLDLHNQIWVSEDHSPPNQQPSEPSWIHSDPRRNLWAFITSTSTADTASMLAAVDLQICDIGYGYHEYASPPFALWHMKPKLDARIFEIDSPHAWHELCVNYRHRAKYPLQDIVYSDLDMDSYLEPDWSKVAEDWDAVHLTLGGLLTSHQVAVKSKDFWTYHHGWDAEQTWWLRWVFTEHERLHDNTPTFQIKEILEDKSIYRFMRGWT
ncbi:MAG: hypothetical protein F4X57_10130 [Chloroflexi bacterium]|nr:hypothetical protein [Chloroflexota bacterium]